MAESENIENINHDKKLAESVRQFPCLYDKRTKEYKDKFITVNAWEKVAEMLDIGEGTL